MPNLVKTVENFVKAMREQNPGLNITVNLTDVPQAVVPVEAIKNNPDGFSKAVDETTNQILEKWSGFVDEDKRVWVSTTVKHIHFVTGEEVEG